MIFTKSYVKIWNCVYDTLENLDPDILFGMIMLSMCYGWVYYQMAQ